MPIVPHVGSKTWPVRIVVLVIYVTLTLLGATMVMPFLMTISGSLSNDFDYYRYRMIPRYVHSPTDRWTKGLVYYFNQTDGWHRQMHSYFPDMPQAWVTWEGIGRDVAGVDRLAAAYLNLTEKQKQYQQQRAADYAEFAADYPLDDTVIPLSDAQAAAFLSDHYAQLITANPQWIDGDESTRNKALRLLNERWKLPYPDFFAIEFERERKFPLAHQSFFYPDDAKYDDFRLIKASARDHYFTPGVQSQWQAWCTKHAVNEAQAKQWPLPRERSTELNDQWHAFVKEVAPATPAVPFAMRAVWRHYLESEEVRLRLKLPTDVPFNVQTYNQLAGTAYTDMTQTPFPVPSNEALPMQELWQHFVQTRYPLRLTRIMVTDDLTRQFQELLKQRFKSIKTANRLLETQYTDWTQFDLASTSPVPASDAAGNPLRAVWADFVKNLPVQERVITSSEQQYQAFLLKRYGSLQAINQSHGTDYLCIEQAFPPLANAYAVTYAQNATAFTWAPTRSNFAVIIDYLLYNGRAIPVTLLLVSLSILATLTINPICAYAMSRFSVKRADKIILYLLAPMAFPAMVSAIPAYLLMRDLGLLNTFIALVLPHAANGMSIFILKGFFDSLPRELYEAATIDGANERQIFMVITMPMMKPILAIQSLTAFLWAYTSWEWALIVCQDSKMWTLSVWLYQANEYWSKTPWIVMAGFVIASIPTLLVFLFCQKIILRGIILPSMK
jgi:ABC-type glycerol-3-phosphate transport system permease component